MDGMSIPRLVFLALVALLPAFGRQRIQGWCEQGNRVITVNTTTSSILTPVQRSFPSCIVTVFNTGTVVKPTIYSDNIGTTKANPFTAATTGYWFFYVDDGVYDVQFSGAGISPTYTVAGDSALGSFLVSQFGGATIDARINACLDALPAGGGTCDTTGISGTFTSSSTITIDAGQQLILSSITIQGTSNPLVSLAGDGAALTCKSPQSSALISTAITMGNPTANVVRVEIGADNTTISGCRIQTPTKTYFDQPVDEAAYYIGNAVYAGGSSATLTKGLHIIGNQILSGNNGVVLDWVNEAVVSENRFVSFSVGLTHLGLFSTSYTVVASNTFQDNGSGMANAVYSKVSSGGMPGNDPDYIMPGNLISGNTATGTFLFETINVSNQLGCAIVGNTLTFSAIGDSGIAVGIRVAASFFSTVPTHSVAVVGNAVNQPDTMTAASIFGILILDDSTNTPGIYDVTVASNTISSPGIGIASTANTSSVVITGNTVYVTGGLNSNGILAADSARITITNNIVRHSPVSCFDVQAVDVIFSGNAANDCGSGLLLTGIAQRVNVSGNLFAADAIGIFVLMNTNPDLIIHNNIYSSNGANITGYTSANLGDLDLTDWKLPINIGLGGAVPVTGQPITIRQDSGAAAIVIYGNEHQEMRIYGADNLGGDSTAAMWRGFTSRGTYDSKAALQNGDAQARLDSFGFDGTQYTDGGMIQAITETGVANGIVPTRWEVRTMNTAGSLRPVFNVRADGTFQSLPVLFAALPTATASNGSQIYCSDCTNQSNPCTNGGSGAFAKRLNGAWDCR